MQDPTQAAISIEGIKSFFEELDPTALMPQMDSIFSKVLLMCRIAVLIGPILLLLLGLSYLLITPKEANYYLGYRCYFGMGSDKAWQFTQRIAGMFFIALGAVLTVVMLVLAMGFGQMQTMDMVWRALWCLVWQAGLTLVTTLVINGMAMYWFDRKGELRKVSARKRRQKKAQKQQNKEDDGGKS